MIPPDIALEKHYEKMDRAEKRRRQQEEEQKTEDTEAESIEVPF